MERKWRKKFISIGAIIFLLSGIGFVPTIQANLDKGYDENEFIDVTVEASGINGVNPYTIKLTQQEAEEVGDLFETIKERLENAETQQENIDIFQWAILQLNEKGLLPKGNGVEETQALMTDTLRRTDWETLVENSSHHRAQPIGDNENRNCLIAGHTSFSLFASMSTIPRLILLFLLSYIRMIRCILTFSLIEKIHELTNYSFPLLTFIYAHINLFMLNMYLSLFLGLALPFLLPIDLGGMITFGYSFPNPLYSTIYRPSEGWIYTNGQNGIIKWNDTFYGHLEYLEDFGLNVGATGYTGIKIWLPFNTFFLGFASKVKLDATHP